METHQLEAKLKSLRLSGMLATLEARLAQARGGELGHLEFLEVLLEDEISRREAKALAERIRRAHFECEVTLEEFDFAYNPGLPAPLIRDLAALRFLERGESVLLYGPVGVGKTHVAQALGHLACRRGCSVLFAKTSRLLAELAGGRADGGWESRLRRLARFDLLILDDFALRAFTGAQGDDFYELALRARRPWLAHPHRQPLTEGLVRAVPQRGGRRRRPRPARELVLPRAHGGQELPAQAAAGTGRQA